MGSDVTVTGPGSQNCNRYYKETDSEQMNSSELTDGQNLQDLQFPK